MKVNCLKRSPGIPANAPQTFMLNEKANEEDDDLYQYIGAFLAFSFLTKQPFSLDLANAVWKQIIGDKILKEDLRNIDEPFYLQLGEKYQPEEGKTDDDIPKVQQEIASYFAKFERQTKAIREGMNKVFGGKLDVIAYLPLEYIQLRICGRPSF